MYYFSLLNENLLKAVSDDIELKYICDLNYKTSPLNLLKKHNNIILTKASGTAQRKYIGEIERRYFNSYPALYEILDSICSEYILLYDYSNIEGKGNIEYTILDDKIKSLEVRNFIRKIIIDKLLTTL